MQTIQLKNPLDMHLHLREGEILQGVLPYTTQSFVGGVVMPNLSTPITNCELASEYQAQIHSLSPCFEAIMTLYLTDSLSQEELLQAKQQGIKILKLYPKGATTNSQDGVSEILTPQVLQILHHAQDLGFILSIHAESNGFSLDREFEFLPIIIELAKTFPKLKIIIEHLSDRRSIDVLETYANVFGTLSLHHLTCTLDDLLGGGLNPHFFCKPILKTSKDRDALLDLALQAHPKVSFGSDSAPHLLSKKTSIPMSAGIFSAPLLLEQLCSLFDRHQALDSLQAFVSDNAIKNYDLKLKSEKIVTLEKRPQTIPHQIQINQDVLIPLFAGQETQWTQC